MRSTDSFIDLKQSAGDSLVRAEIARLFGAKPAARITLAPGMLSGLRHLFSAVQIDRLVITTPDYDAPTHFQTLKVEAVALSALVADLGRAPGGCARILRRDERHERDKP